MVDAEHSQVVEIARLDATPRLDPCATWGGRELCRRALPQRHLEEAAPGPDRERMALRVEANLFEVSRTGHEPLPEHDP